MFFPCLFGWWIGATYEKAATHLDSVETAVSILMLIGMGVASDTSIINLGGTNV
jgi:hypothetical protein